jgi:protein-disulfide isomerase
MNEQDDKSKLFIPIAIVVAGIVVAFAIFFGGGDKPVAVPTDDGTDAVASPQEVAVTPVTEDDHILGNPNAELIVVEYSDYECPFCARFHPTMDQIISEYGSEGKVAWVYRHFPLQIHPDARPAAEASECVAELGGNTAFWDYSRVLFENAPTSLSTENLQSNAVALGIDEEAYTSCVADGRYADKVQQMYDDGLKIAQADPQFGTPYSIILKKDGTQAVIPGAQPYNVVKQVIDAMLAE